jgi:hypothetical protein
MGTTNYLSAFTDEEAKEPMRVNAVEGCNTVTISFNNHCTLFIDSLASLERLEDAIKRCREEFAKKAEASELAKVAAERVPVAVKAEPIPAAPEDAPPF